ncbi:odorant receptor 24a-like [Episyrphus balteatus]|uniref:odorant receptor 24a-like n=1 Tax=Episyrphus balteatus TaxID=286459 RepID=UPI002484FCBB|nr:odorant receptor 24a-like [Episyrphus balteatus]
MDNSLEMSFFRVNKWLLGLIGFWPLDKFNRAKKIKIFFNLILLITAIFGEFRFAVLMRKDPLYAFEVILPCLTKIVTWIKLICFVVYRRDLELILKRLFEHCKTDTKNIEKNKLIARVTYITNIWCKVLYINAVSLLSLFAVKPLLIWVYQFLMSGNKDNWVDLPFPAALPYEDMTRINNKTLYSIIYCFLVHSGTINILGVCGTDGTFLCFCLYISVSYQCLQEDFKRSFKSFRLGGKFAGN